MKKYLIAFVLISSLIVSVDQAHAHAQITATSPLKNKIVKVLPQYVWIEFDGNLITLDGKVTNSLTVSDSKNRRVDTGNSIVGGARITTSLKPRLQAGKYFVSYRVVSEDGHPVTGSYFFIYQP